MTDFPFTQKTLSHGLRALFLPRHDRQTVSFLILIGVGSRYETAKQSGLSHFLEHMFFKGTATRPTAKEIAEALDSIGGEFNAFTGEEYTGYYVKVASDYWQKGADVVSDILLRPLFPQEEIERERGVIREEIRMYTSMPHRHVQHLWQEALFGDHPLGRRIDGSEETITTFNRADFLKYVKHHYHTGNAVVSVAGNFDQPAAEQVLSRLFEALTPGEETHPRPAPKGQPAHRSRHEYRKSLEQSHLVVGVPGVSLMDSQRYVAELLAVLLGGGMSSRMFLSVRERHGLAYTIRTSSDSYTDSGSFATQAGVRTDKATKALELILQEYDRMMQERVSQEELAKAKKMFIGHLMIGLEETNNVALFAGGQELLRKGIQTPEEIKAIVESITPDDIQTVAQTLLAPSRRAIALLGPHKAVTPFEKLLSA